LEILGEDFDVAYQKIFSPSFHGGNCLALHPRRCGHHRGDAMRRPCALGSRTRKIRDTAMYSTAVQAALRFTLLSAMAVSFLSAAFSSSRFCCSKVAQSLRPSSFAQATKLP